MTFACPLVVNCHINQTVTVLQHDNAHNLNVYVAKHAPLGISYKNKKMNANYTHVPYNL